MAGVNVFFHHQVKVSSLLRHQSWEYTLISHEKIAQNMTTGGLVVPKIQ